MFGVGLLTGCLEQLLALVATFFHLEDYVQLQQSGSWALHCLAAGLADLLELEKALPGPVIVLLILPPPETALRSQVELVGFARCCFVNYQTFLLVLYHC